MQANANALALHLAWPNLADVRVAALVALLAAAAVIDVRTMRIPNSLTMSGAALGLVLAAAVPWQWLGPVWAVDGVLWALGGLAAGLVVLLPFYLLRVMGAGDVKLMAMVGAFVGLKEIVPAVVCVFVAGGVVALVFALWRRSLRQMTANVGDIVQWAAFAAMAGGAPARSSGAWTSVGKLPYGVSICVGTLAWLLVKQFAS